MALLILISFEGDKRIFKKNTSITRNPVVLTMGNPNIDKPSNGNRVILNVKAYVNKFNLIYTLLPLIILKPIF